MSDPHVNSPSFVTRRRGLFRFIAIILLASVLFWFFFIEPHPLEKITVARAFHTIAHRGAPANAPENTLAAFRTAAELGADILELDIHQTRDSQLVVIHDATVDRTTNGKGEVKNFSAEEIRKLDAGSWFSPQFSNQHIPLLSEVIDHTSDSIKLLIELKNGSNVYPGIEARICRLLVEKRASHRVILKSFEDGVLDTLRRIAPAIPRLKIVVTHISFLNLIVERGIKFGSLLDDSVQYFQHHWFGLTKGFVDDAHLRGYGVFAWDVNDTRRMKELIQIGVDGIETDHPDQIRDILAGN